MFVHPNEFELLQHLEVPGRARHDEAPDSGQDGWRALRVTVRKLAKRHGARSVLNGLDLDIAAGEFVAVTGRGGMGKTTLLRILAGLERPTGEQGGPPARSPVLFDNFPQWASDDRVRLLFADARLLPWKRVWQNVALGLPGDARARAGEALRQAGLAGRGGDWPAQLTDGQRQRVALARALARRPGLLLLDEPLGGLDALTRIEAQAAIEQAWRRDGFTAVLATRDVYEAVALADRILVIDDGAVVFDERVELARPRARGSPAFAALAARVLRAVLKEPEPPDAARPLAPVIQIRHLRLAV
ncbi:ATP-binding cassette domain-containing protein [Achromobacter marplatensis]|uniref:ATP-binding cassette domain-containing protein n=1 Tax=Achromobacter marplatensis TaxID=470868 RepID=UPI0028EDD65E|nr:ATP-binding cassette domain-containing protein [Achromobacter marplatensis]